MGAETKIEWTEATWSPTVGCSVLSPGCKRCYAMRQAARLERMGVSKYDGLTIAGKEGPVWNGVVRLDADSLDLPLRWKRPRCIFVNSMSDLFHEALPWEDIALVFGVAIAAACLRGHTLQILTKRAERQRELLSRPEFWELANSQASGEIMERVDPLNRRSDDARARLDDYGPDNAPPGIWLGVSVEDQERKTRIDDLRATPAAVRFISFEPLLEELGEIDLTGIGWAIVGAESGPRARPMDLNWVRDIRDACAAASVPMFFKQDATNGRKITLPMLDGRQHAEFPG